MTDTKTILVTGGLGYIGSHTVVELFNTEYLKSNSIKNKFEVVILDDCSSCSDKILPILESMINHKIVFYKVSLNDKTALEECFKKHKFDAVIHFAGKKSVNESIDKPLFYYENNFIGSFNLIEIYMEIEKINQMKMRNIYFLLILMENQSFSLNICLKIQLKLTLILK